MKRAISVGTRSGDARRFTGKYADDGKAKRLAVRAQAGHRCVRCGHPFESGKHGKGEWSPCDERCSHCGPLRIATFDGDGRLAFATVDRPMGDAGEIIKSGTSVEAQWRILTVHHLDGDKSNDAWFNTLALCQRCHLEIQGKVDPRIPYFLEHADWFKPFIAGFYAMKYEGLHLTRVEVMERLPQLLAYECKT